MAATKARKQTTEEPRRPLLSLEEVARVLGLDKMAASPKRAKELVLAMVARGGLVGLKIGKWVMICPDSLDDLLARGGGSGK